MFESLDDQDVHENHEGNGEYEENEILKELDKGAIEISFEESPWEKTAKRQKEKTDGVADFLKNVRVNVVAAETESQIIVKYFYKIEVVRGEANYFLRRSYSMFEWLYNRLIFKNKGVLLPSIPPKDLRATIPLVPEELLQERKRKFSRFLNECIRNFEKLQNFDDLYFFLKSDYSSPSSFHVFMEKNPYSASGFEFKEPLQEVVSKSITSSFFKLKESFWDKFQYFLPFPLTLTGSRPQRLEVNFGETTKGIKKLGELTKNAGLQVETIENYFTEVSLTFHRILKETNATLGLFSKEFEREEQLSQRNLALEEETQERLFGNAQSINALKSKLQVSLFYAFLETAGILRQNRR